LIKPAKAMKKIIYALLLPLVVVSGLLFAHREISNETSNKSIPKPLGGVPSDGVPLSAAEKKAGREKWEATPDGIMFKKWEASPAGKKVHTSATKIMKSVRDYTNMEAIVTSLSLPPGSRLGFGMMVKINGDDYILAFGAEESGKNIANFKNKFEQLHSLKANDKITIKSHFISKAPKYAYPIVTADYVERNSKIIYKRTPRKGGC
jgi:hypothetical protein